MRKSRMRKVQVTLLLLLLPGCFFQASAQQRPQYTQYIFNNYLLNPAISGIENYADLKAGYRRQWAGIDDGPATATLSLHSPIGKKYLRGNANSMESKGTNPMSRSFLQTYMAAEPHHGAGLHLVSDRTGPISRTDVNATYAYHLGITEKLNLSVGFAAGISLEDLDFSRVTLENQADPALAAEDHRRVRPDLSAGLWLYSARYFGGFSVQQLLGRPVIFSEDGEGPDPGRQIPHYFLTAGYKFFLGDDIAAVPSVMVKHVTPAPLSVDINAKIAFRDRFWVGGSYRKRDSFAAMAGFNVSYLFNVSYAYDFTTSALRSVSEGTHEVVLGVLLNNRYKVTCPQRNW
ncbi:MAG TPA: type IX secretion system membrane protein PorP/SprF [Sphingobacteriaceae bacterium]